MKLTTLAECVERLDAVRLVIDERSAAAWVKHALADIIERCRDELEWQEAHARSPERKRWW